MAQVQYCKVKICTLVECDLIVSILDAHCKIKNKSLNKISEECSRARAVECQILILHKTQ